MRFNDAMRADEYRDWLVEAAKGTRGDWTAHRIIEQLDRVTDKQHAKNAAAVLQALISAGDRLPHPDDDLRSLLRKLKDAGLDDEVANVCEVYARAGIDPDRLGGVCNG